MEYIDNENAKHRKKSTKTVKKSKHKHTYKACLIYDKSLNQHLVGKYCTICNKIGNFKMFETVSYKNNYSRIINEEECIKILTKELENLSNDVDIYIVKYTEKE